MIDIGMAEIEFLNKFVPRDICIHTTQWIILDRSIIEKYLLKYEHYWKQFYKGCNQSFADEDYYSNMLGTHAWYFNNVSNKWIDELRNDGYLFLRKINESSQIDVDYLLGLYNYKYFDFDYVLYI